MPSQRPLSDVVNPTAQLPPSIENGRRYVEAHSVSQEQEQDQSSDDEVTDATVSSTNVAKLRRLRYRAKERTNKLLSINDAKSAGAVPYREDDVVNNIIRDPAFNPGTIQSQKQRGKREGAKATLGSIGSFILGIKNPKDALKDKATRTTAGKLSEVQRPYLSPDADAELLAAHDDLSHAESSRSSWQVTSDEDPDLSVGEYRDKLQALKAQRDSLRVGYTTSRHVTRVRVVPKRHLDFPETNSFYKRRSEGEVTNSYDWVKWLGYVIVWYTQDFSAQYIDDFDEIPYDIDSVRRHVERIVVARCVSINS